MSRRGKLEKFAEIRQLDNVYEMTEMGSGLLKYNAYDTIDLKGRWANKAFGNDNRICLELACGRGEYSLGLAPRHPDTNFIGVDIKGARIWKGAKLAKEYGYTNIAFLRTRIEQIDSYFEVEEVDEIWITFADPFIGKENRRMTSPRFLDRYLTILKPGGKINLKTDDDMLYEYSVKTVGEHSGYTIDYCNDDIYSQPLVNVDLNIKTYYENEHLKNRKTIKYLVCHKND